MNRVIKLGKFLPVALCLSIVVGCAAPTFNMPVKRPAGTMLPYDASTSQAKTLSITDTRPAETPFSEGLLSFNVQVEGENIQEVEFLAAALTDELSSRGLSVNAVTSPRQEANLDVVTFKIVNHRVSAFSPLVTFTQFAGDFSVDGKITRIASFIKRGKVPIWVITEEGIVENTFNQPISLLVQDIATQITQQMGNQSISDSVVQSLATEASNTDSDDPLRYMKAYQLGFGNNKSAIPHLVKLIEDPDEYVRLAAISSLGLLGASSEVGRLTTIFNNADLWQERGMALKALADLDTEESRKVVDAEWQRVSTIATPDKESEWNKAILMLYR